MKYEVLYGSPESRYSVTVDADYYSQEKGSATTHFYRQDPSDPCENGRELVATFNLVFSVRREDSEEPELSDAQLWDQFDKLASLLEEKGYRITTSAFPHSRGADLPG
jgi:hypothetical protein